MMGVNHPGIRLAPRAARQAQKGDGEISAQPTAEHRGSAMML